LLDTAEIKGEALPDKVAREVEELSQEILRREPNWSFAHLLRGQLLAAQQRYDQAADALRQAINLGQVAPGVYEQLLYALYASQQFDEADEVLTRLQAFIPNARNLSFLGSQMGGQNDQLPEAILQARQTVQQRRIPRFAGCSSTRRYFASRKT
jgi:tetratricopeptide (TPR) repeat protein